MSQMFGLFEANSGTFQPRNGNWAQKRRVRYWRAWGNTKRDGHLIGDETFFLWPGASRAYADFCDPAAVSRFKVKGKRKLRIICCKDWISVFP